MQSKQFKRARFTGDGEVHHSDEQARFGTVRIHYAEGTTQIFNDVDRAEYFAWASRGFKGRKPQGMRNRQA